MSDIMTCMPFGQLLDWVLQEKKGQDTVFGVHRPYTADPKNDMTIFTRNLETPVGPAAGPHTQLAQNIIASYYAGARFFELKTVQKMDGAELSGTVHMYDHLHIPSDFSVPEVPDRTDGKASQILPLHHL